jgi:hypothetical protein
MKFHAPKSTPPLLPHLRIETWFWVLILSLKLCSGSFAAETTGGKPIALKPWQPLTYPPSEAFAGVEFDLTTRKTLAFGSDIWPVTWADDDQQYTAFGDGAGFNVTNAREANGKARVSMGVARVEGGPDAYRGINVWGGKDAENPAQFSGKGTGILSLDGVLYMWVAGPGSLCVPETRLAVSTNHARTWRLVDWKWTEKDGLFAGVFLNAGKDYAGAPDGGVYVYFTHLNEVPDKPRNWIHETPGRVDLARVPKQRILEAGAYEWFTGLAADGTARWSSKMADRKPVFEDPNGIKVVSVARPPTVGRCLLAYNPRDNRGNFGLFESPHPWGPWRQVAYLKEQPLFLPPEPNSRVSIFHFAPKWWSGGDRYEFTLVFNCGDDAWNTIRGRLLPR